MPTLTEQLVAVVREHPLEQADLDAAALFTLDALANALAGARTAPGRIVLDWAAAQGSDAGREAFRLGALTHILETDDLHRASVVHPGCVVVPAAWAVARREGVGGIALLRAVLHGFEGCCRVGMAVGPAHYRIWHNTATCGPFGSALAVAALLELDAGQARDALGNAGTQSAGLWEFLDTGAMSKHLHAGRAAEAGVLAADLAARGFSGPPAVLEGPRGFFAATCPDADPGAVVRDPLAPWQLHATSIKPWPSCRHTHPVLDAALELHGALAGEVPEAVLVQTYGAAIDVCDRPSPESEYAAKFSLQHCVAAALARGAVGFDDFDAPARAALAPLRLRSTVAAAEPFESAYPAAWGGSVTVRLRGGRSLSAQREHALGDPEAPLARTELVRKARGLLERAGVEAPEALIRALLEMARGGPVPALEFP